MVEVREVVQLALGQKMIVEHRLWEIWMREACLNAE